MCLVATILREKPWLIGPLPRLGCVAFCSCKRHVARACPAAPPVQQTLNLWIPAALGLQQQQLTSFLASCSGCRHSTALHTGDPFKVQNRPAAVAAEPSVGFA